jgi:FkbM family methyltransferase
LKAVRTILKSTGLRTLAEPFSRPIAGGVTWACQHGYLQPSKVQPFLPWRWVLKPFTIYGTGWKCRWFPTEFDAIGHKIFWHGLRGYEIGTLPVILDAIGQSRCFIDVGANCGLYTVSGCMLNPNVRIIAVEPVPKVYAALVNNVTGNKLDSRVKLLNVALGDANGVVAFHEAEDSTMGSFAVDGYWGQPGKTIQVQCFTLDSIIEELKVEPDFMKIDVEGFSHLVLAGATQVLAKFRPRIIVEANPGDPVAVMTKILLSHGYEFQGITQEGLERQSEIDPREGLTNWLCIPRT